jgi:hypothetical protein
MHMNLGEGNADSRFIEAELDLFRNLPFGREEIGGVHVAEQSYIDRAVSEAVNKNGDITILQYILAVPCGLFHDFLGLTNVRGVTGPDHSVETPDRIL